MCRRGPLGPAKDFCYSSTTPVTINAIIIPVLVLLGAWFGSLRPCLESHNTYDHTTVTSAPGSPLFGSTSILLSLS
jgi:hypothetical protein